MSSFLLAELSATCNALGHFTGDKYYTDEHSTETVKDLIKFLRRDGEDHEIRRYLGESNILLTDLVPMLKDHYEDQQLFDVLLRLLVNLTNPVQILYNEVLPEDKTARNYYLQIINHLQWYKEAFVDDTIWAIFLRKLAEIFNIEWQERSEDQNLTVERILILARNVLQVPANSDQEKRPDNDASVHDQILWSLHHSGMIDIFLYLAGSENEKQYYLHILEIICLMLREQNPKELAQVALQRSQIEKQKDEIELLALREQEIKTKMEKIKKYTSGRHSRFGGTFVVKDFKSIGDQDYISHKPLNKLSDISFDKGKSSVRRPKNRRPLEDENPERRSAFTIRLFLKEFCSEFLNGAYNSFMYQVKDDIARGKAQANDESYYFIGLKFFMEFNRSNKFQVKLVSETMSVQSFHFVQTQIEKCYEMMITDKKKIHLWSRRMHLALKAYQELFTNLACMDNSQNETVKEPSKVIKSNIFYVVEYRELILTLLKNYDDIKMSKLFLKDLIETSYIFLKLLEKFCGPNETLIVQKKQKKIRKKKSRKLSEKPVINQEALWEEISPQVSTILDNNHEITKEMVPFDATSSTTIEEQKYDAMRKIQILLYKNQYEESISLLRAAREVWPENDSFGKSDISPSEEFLALREIFFADIGNSLNDLTEQPAQTHEESSEEDEEDEEEEQERSTNFEEHHLKFGEFIGRFGDPKVIQACAILLKNFQQNSVYTNHCLIKLMHRIAWDSKQAPLFFQASLFRTFQQILKNQQSKHQELIKFALFIIRKFVELAKSNSKIYMEMLFWKSNRESYEIEFGYCTYEDQSKASKITWSEEQEDELRRLYEEFMSQNDRQEDMVDWILRNMIDDSRSKKGVLKKLRELGYNVDAKALRKTTIRNNPSKYWSEEDEEQLKQLFEEFRESMDPVGCLMERLNAPRSKPQIVNKIIELGLVADKKELRKKRNKSNNKKKKQADSDSDNSDNKNTKTEKKPRKKKSKQVKNRQFTTAELCTALKESFDKGFQEALIWVRDALQDIIDDDDEDLEESIPLVPFESHIIEAMENKIFLNSIKALGAVPPRNEQEMYWRIPENLSREALKIKVDFINKALNGELLRDENELFNEENIIESPQNQKASDSEASLSDDADDSDVLSSSNSDDENKIKNNKKRKALPMNNESDDLLEEIEHSSKKPKRLSDEYNSEKVIESTENSEHNLNINNSGDVNNSEEKINEEENILNDEGDNLGNSSGHINTNEIEEFVIKKRKPSRPIISSDEED